MIKRVWSGTIRFLGSARLATWLLAILGVWVTLATLVPQTNDSAAKVTAWAAAHPALEPVVRALGLHQAYTSWGCLACVVLLGVSTVFCAWERTKAASGRARTLRDAASITGSSLAERHDLKLACDPSLSVQDVFSTTSETLAGLGIKTTRRSDVLVAVSPPWSVWGSPVFHWALLSLIAAILVGNLQRSEGLMGVAVGQTQVDGPASYGILHTGPLHNWNWVHRSIRVDAFSPTYNLGGIDRGPTPTVTVIDSAGHVIKTQMVYPNMTLQTGTLTIHTNDYGLAAHISLVKPSGTEASGVELVDFSDTALGGTVNAAPLYVRNSATGEVQLAIAVTVPLDQQGGQYLASLPKDPTARVVVTSLGGAPLLDRVVRPGQDVVLPSGDSLRLDGVGYYSRLSVVDDWTIPLLYVGLAVAGLGLTLAVSARQQLVLLTVVEGQDGTELVGSVRLWRNSPTSRNEIEQELARALGEAVKGNVS